MADHFPYRKYGRNASYERRRRRRHGWRLNHDVWAWLFVVVILGWLLVMEWLR